MKKISRQLKWQRKNKALGLCTICSKVSAPRALCDHHRKLAIERNKKRPGYMKLWQKKNEVHYKMYQAKYRQEHKKEAE